MFCPGDRFVFYNKPKRQADGSQTNIKITKTGRRLKLILQKYKNKPYLGRAP